MRPKPVVEVQPLERRVLACAFTPDAHPAAAEASAAPASAVAAEVPRYNTPFLTDAQLENHASMTAAEIRAFLASTGSYFRQSIPDADGVTFDPAAVIAAAAAQYRISPKVILATLQKEHSGLTRTTRPADAQMRFLMGCVSATTARQQFACAAERFRSYHDSLARTGSTVSGWRVGVAKTTQDGVSVTPATRAVAGQFTYTPYAGVQWGGNRATVGGVYLFYDAWNDYGFFDSARPTATASAANVLATGSSTPHTFRVTFADDAGVDVSDVVSNNAAVRVTGPNGFSRLATYVSLSSAGDGTPRTATYRVSAPGGTWDGADAGAYTVRVEEAQVGDVHNNFVAAGPVGTFAVSRPAAVVGRHVFYNHSAFDGNDAAPGPADDAAVAPDKVALRVGQAASAANVTGYSRGINGVMVDVRGLPATATLGAGDFEFRAGAGADAGAWPAAPAPAAVALRRGAGAAGSDRVTVTWSDEAIRNAWLRVTLKANPDKLIPSADVFYFGNLAGNAAGGAGDAFVVDGADHVAMRRSLSTVQVPLSDPHDHDRNGTVDVRDLIVTRANLLTTLPPPGATVAGAWSGDSVSLLGWDGPRWDGTTAAGAEAGLRAPVPRRRLHGEILQPPAPS